MELTTGIPACDLADVQALLKCSGSANGGINDFLSLMHRLRGESSRESCQCSRSYYPTICNATDYLFLFAI
jgi:hypothetical protein